MRTGPHLNSSTVRIGKGLEVIGVQRRSSCEGCVSTKEMVAKISSSLSQPVKAWTSVKPPPFPFPFFSLPERPNGWRRPLRFDLGAAPVPFLESGEWVRLNRRRSAHAIWDDQLEFSGDLLRRNVEPAPGQNITRVRVHNVKLHCRLA